MTRATAAIVASIGAAVLWAPLECRTKAAAALPFAIAAAALVLAGRRRPVSVAPRGVGVGVGVGTGAGIGADVSDAGVPGGASNTRILGAGASVTPVPDAGVLVARAPVAAANASLPLRSRLPQIAFGVLATAGLAQMFFAPPPQMPFARAAGFRGFSALSLIFLSAYLCLHLRGSFRKARFGFLLASFAAMALAATIPLLDVACAVLAGFLFRVLAGTSGELAALALLFPLPSGTTVPLAIALALLAALRRTRFVPLVAAAAGAAFCAAAALGSVAACASPALGLGLLAATAASAIPQEP